MSIKIKDDAKAQAQVLSMPVSRIELVLGQPAPFHKDYFTQKRTRDFLRASYKGGAKYKKALDADSNHVLEKHPQESEESYSRRLRLAVYRNYCKPIITKYNDFVFIQPIKRDNKNTKFKEWCNDVDMLGSSFASFIRDHIRDAQIAGVDYCIFESTKEADKTQEQTKNEKDQLYLIALDADRVINWIEDSGVLTEALVAFPQKGEVRLYTKDTITIAQIKKDTSEISAQTDIANQYGFPIIRFTALDDCASQIEDIAECNKSLFNMDALLREELHNQTFNNWFVSGTGINPELVQGAAATLAGRKIWCLNCTDLKVTRCGSDVSQAESIRDTLTGDVKEIYRLSGLTMPDVAQGKSESGRALHIRWNDVEITAAAIADHAEEVENNIIDSWIIAMGGNEAVEHSEYPEEFDTEELDGTLQMTLDVITSELPWTLKELQIKEFASRAFPKQMGEINKDLQSELENMGKQNEENRNNIAAMNASQAAGNLPPEKGEEKE